MWLDMDLLINRMNFTLPFDTFQGRDLVMHGQIKGILQGEASWGRL